MILNEIYFMEAKREMFKIIEEQIIQRRREYELYQKAIQEKYKYI